MAVGTTNFPTSLDTVLELVEVTNNASSALTTAITNIQTTITVDDPAEFPSSGFATITDSLTAPTKTEIIAYTGKSGSDLTGVTRAAQGTTAQAFTTGYVEVRPTKGHHEALRGAVIAIETKLGTGSTIALNKLATVTASRALVSDASGYVSASSVTATEIGYVSGVTSAIQTQLGAKAATGAVGSSGLTMATARILGRSTAGSGAIEEITVGSGLSLSGGTLTATGGGGSGTVTSVGLSLPAIFNVSNSPVTTSGTLTGALADQNANIVFAGPSTGAATAPTFRSLVAADIPGVLSVTKLSNLTSNGFVKTGSGDGTLSVDTSTYLTANQTITLSGDVTGSGTTAITATIASAAVTYAKIQNVSATSRILGRKTAGAGSIEELTLTEALDFAGTAAQGDVLYRGASGWALLPAGTNGHYLQTQGAGANPQWAAAAGGGGITIGTTAITSGTAGRILYETSGNVVGETAGFSYQPGASPNVTITAQNASYTALYVNSAATPSAAPFQVAINGTVNFSVTSTGAPSSPGAGSNSERYGAGSSATQTDTTVFGNGATATSGAWAVAIGTSATGAGNSSVAIGRNASTTAGSVSQIAIGAGAAASGGVGVDGVIIMGRDSGNSSQASIFIAGSGNYPINNVFFGKGYVNATPTAYTINGTGGSGSNIAGADLQLAGGRGTGTGAAGKVSIQTAPAGSSGSSLNALATALQVDASTTAGDTRLLIYDVDNATLERVTVGAADSGGTGYKVLRIPN